MAYSNIKQKEKAFLVGVSTDPKENYDVNMSELKSLAKTAGLVVIGDDFQFVREITPATLIGTGKVLEIKEEAQEADVIIVDYELTGSQVRNLSDIIGVRVIDRIALILDIFAGRAQSSEGKLQVKLAQNKYYLPRLSSISGSSGRFGSAGVGMRGPGETKLELDKRAISREIASLEKEIEKIKQRRALNRNARNKSGKKKIAIVGYTNAGKSTLLNVLTKENIYADDKLFATLDTTTRILYLGERYEAVITDTVGFISKLPHALIDAFSATLEEAMDADLILHVVDVSNPFYEVQMEVVNQVLKDLNIQNKPMIIAYNKSDKYHELKEIKDNEVIISARKGKGIDILKNKITEILF